MAWGADYRRESPERTHDLIGRSRRRVVGLLRALWEDKREQPP